MIPAITTWRESCFGVHLRILKDLPRSVALDAVDET
jgi:hypothetical protein